MIFNILQREKSKLKAWTLGLVSKNVMETMFFSPNRGGFFQIICKNQKKLLMTDT